LVPSLNQPHFAALIPHQPQQVIIRFIKEIGHSLSSIHHSNYHLLIFSIYCEPLH